jgi:hypothetical protein
MPKMITAGFSCAMMLDDFRLLPLFFHAALLPSVILLMFFAMRERACTAAMREDSARDAAMRDAPARLRARLIDFHHFH